MDIPTRHIPTNLFDDREFEQLKNQLQELTSPSADTHNARSVEIRSSDSVETREEQCKRILNQMAEITRRISSTLWAGLVSDVWDRSPHKNN